MNRQQRRALAKQAGGPSPQPQAVSSLLAGAIEQHRAGRTAEAIHLYERALSARPGPGGPAIASGDLARAHVSLVRALLDRGDIDRALVAALRGIEQTGSLEIRTLFVLCAREATLKPVPPGLHRALMQAFEEGWASWPEISRAACRLLRLGLASGAGLTGSDLLICHLVSAPITDPVLEIHLAGIRAGLLENPFAGGDLELRCALARQGFLNDYAFATEPAERDRVAELRAGISAALASGAALEPAALATLAAYEPLDRLAGVHALAGRTWPPPLLPLLVQQVEEPEEEARLAAALPRLTGIEDAVSTDVRRHYEENPYPRWILPPVLGTGPVSADEFVRRAFPVVAARPLKTAEPDILIAGCGTGLQAIGARLRFAGARILAVDLSLASLAYAARRTRALGLDRLDYAQADILKLASLDRQFDIIEANGVLHHLADPMAGWSSLLALLRPGGLMGVALYSALGRRHVAAARDFVRQQGFPATPDGIRDARRALRALPAGDIARTVIDSADFYTLSGCRDLIFHVQEQHAALPEIAGFIERQGLRFLGFQKDEWTLRMYRSRFPEDPTATRLDLWHIFESEHPDCFAKMYQFWVQRD